MSDLTLDDFGGNEELFKKYEDSVHGLKNKNSELLGKLEKQDELKASAADKERIAEEARAAAKNAEIEKLEAQNKYEEAQKLREEERAELIAKAEQEAKLSTDELKQVRYEAVEAMVFAGLLDDPVVQVAAGALLKESVTLERIDGKMTASLTLDGKTYSSVGEFLEAAKAHKTWSAMIKAPETKGGGAQNSLGKVTTKSENEAIATAKKSGDVAGVINAHLAQNLKVN